MTTFMPFLQAIEEVSYDLLEEVYTHDEIRTRKRHKEGRNEEKSSLMAA